VGHIIPVVRVLDDLYQAGHTQDPQQVRQHLLRVGHGQLLVVLREDDVPFEPGRVYSGNAAAPPAVVQGAVDRSSIGVGQTVLWVQLDGLAVFTRARCESPSLSYTQPRLL